MEQFAVCLTSWSPSPQCMISFFCPYLCKLLLGLDGIMETEHTDVLLTSALLGLDQTSSTVNAHNQASSDLGIKCAAVTSLLDAEDATNPSDDLMRGGVGWLVQVDDTISTSHRKTDVNGVTLNGQRQPSNYQTMEHQADPVRSGPT